jgi:hypothetical protein
MQCMRSMGRSYIVLLLGNFHVLFLFDRMLALLFSHVSRGCAAACESLAVLLWFNDATSLSSLAQLAPLGTWDLDAFCYAAVGDAA